MITSRIDNVTEVGDEHRKIDPPYPKSVKIELTGRCNLKCEFCAHKDGLRDVSDIKWEFFTRIVEELHSIGVKELGMFYLGESLLYKKLPEAIKYAKDLGISYVFLTTNGVTNNFDRLKGAVDCGLDSLKFSLNFCDDDQFKEVTGLKTSKLDLVVENIKNISEYIKESGSKCKVYASSIRYSDEQVERMAPLLETMSGFLDEHYWLPLYGQAGLVPFEGMDGGNVGRFGNMVSPIPCWTLFTEGHITYDGRLSACCFDHDGRFDMGDLNTSSFMELWGSEKFKSLRECHLRGDIINTVCDGCFG